MTNEQQINLKNIANVNVLVSLGTLATVLTVLMFVVQMKVRAEDYLNKAVLVDDFRQWEYANSKATPSLVIPVSMDTIHRENHDTKPRFK